MGTSIVAVMRSRSMVSSTSPGSKYGTTTSDPPNSSTGMKNAAPAWLSGVHMRKRGSRGHSHSVSMICDIAAPDR